MVHNPLNLSQPTLDELDKLSNSLMRIQINVAQSLVPTLQRHIALLKHKADPKTPIPADTPISGRDLKYDTELLFQMERIQQLADIISGREIGQAAMSPDSLMQNVRELLDYSKNTPGFSPNLMPAYRDIIANDGPVRQELEAKYTEIHGPEQRQSTISRLLGRGKRLPRQDEPRGGGTPGAGR